MPLINDIRQRVERLVRAQYYATLSKCHEFNQEYEEALKGDEDARQKAKDWSVQAMKTLEQIHHVRLRHGLAYHLFCERVVKPLLTGEYTEQE